METLEMITKALETVIEQKAEEKAKANAIDLNQVIEYIKGYRSVEEMNAIFDAFQQKDRNGEFEILDNYYQNRIDDDDSIIDKNNLDVETVDECGLLKDCFDEYLDNADYSDLREVAKDIIDRL